MLNNKLFCIFILFASLLSFLRPISYWTLKWANRAYGWGLAKKCLERREFLCGFQCEAELCLILLLLQVLFLRLCLHLYLCSMSSPVCLHNHVNLNLCQNTQLSWGLFMSVGPVFLPHPHTHSPAPRISCLHNSIKKSGRGFLFAFPSHVNGSLALSG